MSTHVERQAGLGIEIDAELVGIDVGSAHRPRVGGRGSRDSPLPRGWATSYGAELVGVTGRRERDAARFGKPLRRFGHPLSGRTARRARRRGTASAPWDARTHPAAHRVTTAQVVLHDSRALVHPGRGRRPCRGWSPGRRAPRHRARSQESASIHATPVSRARFAVIEGKDFEERSGILRWFVWMTTPTGPGETWAQAHVFSCSSTGGERWPTARRSPARSCPPSPPWASTLRRRDHGIRARQRDAGPHRPRRRSTSTRSPGPSRYQHLLDRARSSRRSMARTRSKSAARASSGRSAGRSTSGARSDPRHRSRCAPRQKRRRVGSAGSSSRRTTVMRAHARRRPH